MKAMSPRQHKVAAVVQQAVAMALLRGDVASTLPLSRLTVADVWLSPDLRLARIYLQVPTEWNMQATLATVNAELARPLRGVLGKAMANKSIPALEFFAYGQL